MCALCAPPIPPGAGAKVDDVGKFMYYLSGPWGPAAQDAQREDLCDSP